MRLGPLDRLPPRRRGLRRLTELRAAQAAPGGESLFHDHLERRGEGIASIASMFHERADGDAVKTAFKERFGLDVINRANIGDHIEYYYVDTQRDFGCPIESGSGHAIDFVGLARVYPNPGATLGPSPVGGIGYRIVAITLVVRDLETKVRNHRAAFGWGPWRMNDSRRPGDFDAMTFRGQPAFFDATIAQTVVGDVVYEIVEPRGGSSPWQEFVDRTGEGLMGITVIPVAPATINDVIRQFAAGGIGQLASGRLGGADWRLLDTKDRAVVRLPSGRPQSPANPGVSRPCPCSKRRRRRLPAGRAP